MTSDDVLKLIDAGYTKAEIDALMIDKANETEKATETAATAATGKATETEKATETTATAAIDTQSTVNDTVSNLALLTAINNLTKAVQENNRNNITSDGNTKATTESVTDIMSKMFK